MNPLLATKLHIPSIRRNVVPRPRLIERLNAGVDRKLTLVSAPAGFGKTTLVREWVADLQSATADGAEAGPRIAWLSLDEGDSHPTRFLRYLIAALNQVAGSKTVLGEGALALLGARQPPPAEHLLTALINEAAALAGRIFVILDDYHNIQSSQVDDALTFLLDHLPPQLHLVIATRDDPQLPVARLRAGGLLNELRAADLRFSTDEAAEFLNRAMKLNLSPKDVAALENRTEGWIAGLQLAAISMRGREDTAGLIRAFTGSHRFVLDYLIEEVLERQPESLQAFLLKTAIPDRLTGSLCDALTGQSDGRRILEELEQANLFIVPLDNERTWYRYHHLFHDLLRGRLRQTQADQVPSLHLRASTWFDENGFTEEAILHAILAEDYEQAARKIELAADAVWERGEDRKLQEWIEALPADLVRSRPGLGVYQAWYSIAAGQIDLAGEVLKTAEKAVPSVAAEAAGQEDGPGRLALRGRIATAQAFLAFYRGDLPGIVRYARRALEELPEQQRSWRSTATHVLGDAYDFQGEMESAYRARLEALEASRSTGNSYVHLIANLKLAIVLRHRGELRQVVEICERQTQAAQAGGLAQTVVAGWLQAIWGEALAELNDLEEALQRATWGVELTERGGDVAMLAWSYQCLTRVRYSRGDWVGAEEIVRKLEHAARDQFVPPWIANVMAAWQGRIWLARGMLEAASRWVDDRGLDPAGALEYVHESELIVQARVYLARGQQHEAVQLLRRLSEAAQAGGRISKVIEITVLRALAHHAGGELDLAIDALEGCLPLAEAGGFIRTIVDEGQPMGQLLREAQRKGIFPEYIRRLSAAFADSEQEETVPKVAEVEASGLVEPLSERELEVLSLLAEGLTNRDIADRLYLSLNTVKVHTRNIYGKLGVNSRTQAAARARELGLLPLA